MKNYIAWNREQALPLWATAGFDRWRGRFVERLDLAGGPIAVPHRAMVQARQIYVYAHAAALGWYPPGGELADAAMASLRRDFCADDGSVASVAFSIEPTSGTILSARRDSYTMAFVLFAVAHLFALTQDRSLLEFARRLVAYLDREMVDSLHGGVIDVAEGRLAPKRQNPQMHLLEAYLALDQAAPGHGYGERADRLVALFHDRLVSCEGGVLLEHFSHDWSAHPDSAKAGLFEPGHHYEWIWLLDTHQRNSGRDNRAWCDTLYATAQDHGHAQSGLIFDEVHAARHVVKWSHRLWPHTEAIKAAAARHRQGDVNALPFARRMAALLADRFLDSPFTGGWSDQCTANGVAIVDYVPASSLYHLFLAASEADAAFERPPVDREIPCPP